MNPMKTYSNTTGRPCCSVSVSLAAVMLLLWVAPSFGQVSAPSAIPAPAQAEGGQQITPQPPPEPPFHTAPPEKKQFTVEYVYRYTERLYTPSVPLKNVAQSAATYITPEATVTAMISAMQSLDYDWWLSLWGTQSKNLLVQESNTLQHDANFWQQFWKRSVVGQPVTFVKRLEAQQYVILEVRLGPAPPPGARDLLMPIVLKLEGPRWVLTREIDNAGFFPGASLGQATQSFPAGFGRSTEFGGQANRFLQAQAYFFREQPGGADSSTKVVW